MFHWSDSFTSLVRFWQPQFDGLTRLTLTPLDFTTDLRHWCPSLEFGGYGPYSVY